jgi:hypothetical protein
MKMVAESIHVHITFCTFPIVHAEIELLSLPIAVCLLHEKEILWLENMLSHWQPRQFLLLL